jgi:hypothetical protein
MKNTLWNQCLFEIIKRARRKREDVISLKDVDDLVLKKSKKELSNEVNDDSSPRTCS